MGLYSRVLVIGVAGGLFLLPAAYAQGNGYDKLVSQAQADLNAGNAAQALVESQQAIKAAPARWEAYVVAGGALQTEHQFDQAIADYSQAVEHAPEAKKTSVRALMQKAQTELASAQSNPRNAKASASPEASDAGTGPSYEETVQYIQENVKRAGDTAMNNQTQLRDGSSFAEQQVYSAQFDGCNAVTIVMLHYAGDASDHSHDQTDFVFPLASTEIYANFGQSHGGNFLRSSPPPSPAVSFELTGGSLSWHSNSLPDSSSSSFRQEGAVPAHNTGLNSDYKDYEGVTGNFIIYSAYMNPVVTVPFNFAGSDAIPPHLANAFQHLQQICKDHPEQAPKQPF